MIRIALIILICYLGYVFYKGSQTKVRPGLIPPNKKKLFARTATGTKRGCPTPKVFVDYIEGKIAGDQKEKIRNHIDNCKDCMDALQAVFDMTPEKLNKDLSKQ